MALNDKADKFFVIVTHGDKESKKEFSSETEAFDFVKQAKLLKVKNPQVGIKLRVSLGDSYLYPIHSGELMRDKNGNILMTLSGIPMRKILVIPKKKGELYCPECGFYTKFVPNAFLGTVRCECCGLSTNDFYVKTTNALWETVKKS